MSTAFNLYSPTAMPSAIFSQCVRGVPPYPDPPTDFPLPPLLTADDDGEGAVAALVLVLVVGGVE